MAYSNMEPDTEENDTVKEAQYAEPAFDTAEENDLADSLDIRYLHMEDEEVAVVAQTGDRSAEEYLLVKYKNMVRSRARSYFLIGADHEDIMQEGMIGLFKAIQDYRPERLSSFKVFAEICITRQILSAIKAASRMKHSPLNTYVSLNKPLFDEDGERTLLDVVAESSIQNPEDLMISRDDAHSIEKQAKKILSPLEQRVLSDYVAGKSYHEIARDLNRSDKSIDNALQRIKKKMEKAITESRKAEE